MGALLIALAPTLHHFASLSLARTYYIGGSGGFLFLVSLLFLCSEKRTLILKPPTRNESRSSTPLQSYRRDARRTPPAPIELVDVTPSVDGLPHSPMPPAALHSLQDSLTLSETPSSAALSASPVLDGSFRGTPQVDRVLSFLSPDMASPTGLLTVDSAAVVSPANVRAYAPSVNGARLENSAAAVVSPQGTVVTQSPSARPNIFGLPQSNSRGVLTPGTHKLFE